MPLQIKMKNSILISTEQSKKTLIYKVFPTLIAGVFIWFISTLFHGGYLGIVIFTPTFWNVLITALISFPLAMLAVIGIIMGVAMEKDWISFLSFLGLAWMTGMVEWPILYWASMTVGFEAAKSFLYLATLIGTISTVLAFMVGIVLFTLMKRQPTMVTIILIGTVLVILFGIMGLFILRWAMIMSFMFLGLPLLTDALYGYSVIALIVFYGYAIIYGFVGHHLLEEEDKTWMLVVLYFYYIVIRVIIYLFMAMVSSASRNRRIKIKS